MTRLYAALRRQPVRTYMYGLLAPAVALLGAYGLTTPAKGALWIALGGVVLLPVGVEAARAKVTPLSRPRNKDGVPLVSSEGADEPPPDAAPPPVWLP